MTRPFPGAFLKGFGIFFWVFLIAFPLHGDDTSSQITIMKKISTASIKSALATTKNIDEVAAKVGVSTSELKHICLALKITLPVSPEKPAPTPAPVPLPVKHPEGELYTDAILEYHQKTPYIILVDKSEHRLYLLKYADAQPRIAEVYDCKTGKNTGDKQERGDHRTPEGVYFFVEKYSRPQIVSQVGKDNAYQYGETAFVTDFPNQIDQVKGKNGGGIWLHGTDEPFESTPSRHPRVRGHHERNHQEAELLYHARTDPHDRGGQAEHRTENRSRIGAERGPRPDRAMAERMGRKEDR